MLRCLEHQHKFKDAAVLYKRKITEFTNTDSMPCGGGDIYEEYGEALAGIGDYNGAAVEFHLARTHISLH